MDEAPLSTHRRKRDPRRTAEPMGAAVTPSTGRETFIVHEHHARSLHWDLRLERGGVLVSWAIPKGLPPDPKANHLAVHVEDHPLEYGSFSGSIPAGQYGAGTVRIWDHGYYETEKWTDREVKVVLHGSNVEGRFVLFRTRGNDWMIHRMDGAVHADWIALPTDLAPMLAAPSTSLPATDKHWSYELSWGGVRALVAVEGGRIRVASAVGRDITGTYPELKPLGNAMGTTQVLLDGAIVVFTQGGLIDARLLEARSHVTSTAAARRLARRTPAVLLVFDALHLDGRALLARPYHRRREVLDELALEGDFWQTPPNFGDHRDAALKASQTYGLDGIIAKRTDSPYRAGERSSDWLKIDCLGAQ